jgi:hypothetical protein
MKSLFNFVNRIGVVIEAFACLCIAGVSYWAVWNGEAFSNEKSLSVVVNALALIVGTFFLIAAWRVLRWCKH